MLTPTSDVVAVVSRASARAERALIIHSRVVVDAIFCIGDRAAEVEALRRLDRASLRLATACREARQIPNPSWDLRRAIASAEVTLRSIETWICY